MKDFFDQIKSITDLLNVGRLIFYPFAGALVVVPLYLILRLALVGPALTLTAPCPFRVLRARQGYASSTRQGHR